MMEFVTYAMAFMCGVGVGIGVAKSNLKWVLFSIVVTGGVVYGWREFEFSPGRTTLVEPELGELAVPFAVIAVGTAVVFYFGTILARD